MGVKRPGCEADHSPPTSAEVKKCGSIHLLSHTLSWRNAWLVKHRANFTFSFTSIIPMYTFVWRTFAFSVHIYKTVRGNINLQQLNARTNGNHWTETWGLFSQSPAHFIWLEDTKLLKIVSQLEIASLLLLWSTDSGLKCSILASLLCFACTRTQIHSPKELEISEVMNARWWSNCLSQPFLVYKVRQFNSRNSPAKAKFAYLCTSGCCRLRNTLLVKLCTSWDDVSTAGNRLENRFRNISQ
jgi:hypothetical protein